MDAKEVGREFLNKVSTYLVSLPFDSKVLQEAVTDPDLDRGSRELAAGVLIHTLSPIKDGSAIERYLEDVFLVRLLLHRLAQAADEGFAAFKRRFSEVYDVLDEDVALFEQVLGADVWRWLGQRSESFGRLLFKGKRPGQYVDDESAWDTLYEAGLDFQTNYKISEAAVQNRLRRPEQIVEQLTRRCAEDAKKR